MAIGLSRSPENELIKKENIYEKPRIASIQISETRSSIIDFSVNTRKVSQKKRIKTFYAILDSNPVH